MKFQKDSLLWQNTPKSAPSSPGVKSHKKRKIIFLQDLKLYNFNHFSFTIKKKKKDEGK